MSKPAESRPANEARFDTQLKDADGDFFISRWMNAGSIKDFVQGAFERPTKNDMANLPPELNPITNLDNYREEVRRSPELSLIAIVFTKLLLPKLMKIVGLAISTSGLGAVTPIFTKQILGFIDIANPTAQQQATAYSFGGAWVGTHGAEVFSGEYLEKTMFQQALKVEQILNVEILRKITRLRSDTRKKYMIDEEMHILNNYVKRAFMFVRSCAVFIASPVKIVTVQMLVYNEIGPVGFVLGGVMILVSLVQVIISRSLSKAQRIKMQAATERSQFNLSAFASIKHIRQLGWEDYIMKKNAEIRERENVANTKYFRLKSVNSTIAMMAPTIIILIILLTQYIMSSEINISIAKIYTVLAFISMVYQPSRELFSAVPWAIEGFIAFRKIDALLKSPEAEEIDNYDKELLKGEIITRQGYQGTFEEEFDKLAQMPDQQIDIPKVLQKIPTNAEVSEVNLLQNAGISGLSAESCVGKKLGEKLKIKKSSVTLPAAIHISPGSRYIVVGSPNERKAFLYAIMGKLVTIEGKIRFGGKVGYIPESPWLSQSTIKDNILFGSEEDAAKLKKVYEVTKLNDQLKKLPKQAQTVILQNATNLTTVQSLMIGIARVLYSQPDILLMENTFEWFVNDSKKLASSIYAQICKQYPNMTIIQTLEPVWKIQKDLSHKKFFFKEQPDNKLPPLGTSMNVISFHNGVIRDHLPFSKFKQWENPSKAQRLGTTNHIVKLPLKKNTIEDNGEDIDLIDQQISEEQALIKQRRQAELQYKCQKFTRYLLKYTQGMSKEEIAGRLLDPAGTSKKVVAQRAKRTKGVPFAIYVTLFRSVGYRPYVLLIALIILAQSIRVFSDWWIGSMSNLPWTLSQANAMYTYVGLSLFYALMSLGIGLVGPKISRDSAEAISKKVCNTLARSRLSWFENKNVSEIANQMNIKTEEIFRLNTIARHIVRNILLFISTMVLVGYNNPSFAGIAVAITLLSIFIMFLYVRQERESRELGREFNEPVKKVFDDAVRGTEAMKAVNQLESYKTEVVKPVYRKQVHANYDKNISQGMAILTKLTSMIGVSGTAFLSVGSNSATSAFAGNAAVAGTSINFTQQLNNIMVAITSDFKDLEEGLRESVFKAYSALETAREDQDGMIPPPFWPLHNTVTFRRVSLEEPDHSLPALTEQSFTIPAGRKVAICGTRGGKAILMAICKQIKPDQGKILIGGVDISTIKPSELTKKVVILDEEPFFFNGTIRDNLAPQKQVRKTPKQGSQEEKEMKAKRAQLDTHLKGLLKLVGIWDSLPTEKDNQPLYADEESVEESCKVLSFYGDDDKSHLEKQKKVEEELITEEKLDYKITDVKKQLSSGIRQRLNIVRALLLRPSVLLCYNHLSKLRKNTADELNRILINHLKQTTIISYVEKPHKAQFANFNKVFYNMRGQIIDVGPYERQSLRQKIYDKIKEKVPEFGKTLNEFLRQPIGFGASKRRLSEYRFTPQFQAYVMSKVQQNTIYLHQIDKKNNEGWVPTWPQGQRPSFQSPSDPKPPTDQGNRQPNRVFDQTRVRAKSIEGDNHELEGLQRSRSKSID